MPTQIDNFKTKTAPATGLPDPFYRRFPAAYQKATRKLSLAARGAYSDIIDLIMIHDGPIPDDDMWMASSLHVKQRQWRLVRAELLEAKKIQIVDGHITNERSEREIEWREGVKEEKRSRYQKPRLGDAKRNVSRSNPGCSTTVSRLLHDCSTDVSRKLLEGKSSDSNGGTSTEVEASYEARATDTDVSVAEADTRAAAAPSTREISKKLFEAGGDALADQAVAPGLASMSTPLWWIEQGCDLDRDIVPAVTALALRERRKRGRGIRSWEYFTHAVAEAKAQRERGLPAVGVVVPFGEKPVDPKQRALDELMRSAMGLAPLGATA